MITLLLRLLRLLPLLCGAHRHVALESLALRHQLAVYKKTVSRPKICRSDRLFWVALSRVWAGWRQALVIVSPNTVAAVAAAPLPRVLDQALRPARRGPPASQRADQGPCHTNGRGESALGRAANPW